METYVGIKQLIGKYIGCEKEIRSFVENKQPSRIMCRVIPFLLRKGKKEKVCCAEDPSDPSGKIHGNADSHADYG